MSRRSNDLSSNVFNTSNYDAVSPIKKPSSFNRYDNADERRRDLSSRGITPVLHKFDANNLNHLTPLSQTRNNQSLSPFFGTLTKRNNNSPLSPSTWQKIKSNIKRPRYDDTPIGLGFGLKTDKSVNENLLSLTEINFAPLPATQLFRDPVLSFEKIDIDKNGYSNTKTLASANSMQNIKKLISKTSIIDIKEGIINERVGCNCRNSKCLKLYCECLRNGDFCLPGCNCSDCENHALSQLRQEKVKHIEKKNPLAFKPTIALVDNIHIAKVNSKGCNCRKSNCLKNYCECHQFGMRCGEHCKCVSCKNTVDHAKPKASKALKRKTEFKDFNTKFPSVSFF